MSARRIAQLLTPLLLLAVSACTAGADADDGAVPPAADRPPFADCAALAGPPQTTPTAASTAEPAAVAVPARPGAAASEPGAAASGPAADPQPLPALALPCYTGGGTVQLAGLRGPAVVNLWASWCSPCRKELPVLQRFADRAAGRVHVLGVVSTDTPVGSAALAADLGLTFPHLVDDDGQLRRALRRPNLPVTLFVDGAGQIRLIHNSKVFDAPTLDAFAAEHLGVRLP